MEDEVFCLFDDLVCAETEMVLNAKTGLDQEVVEEEAVGEHYGKKRIRFGSQAFLLFQFLNTVGVGVAEVFCHVAVNAVDVFAVELDHIHIDQHNMVAILLDHLADGPRQCGDIVRKLGALNQLVEFGIGITEEGPILFE